MGVWIACASFFDYNILGDAGELNVTQSTVVIYVNLKWMIAKNSIWSLCIFHQIKKVPLLSGRKNKSNKDNE